MSIRITTNIADTANAEAELVIATHGGAAIHADELLACALLITHPQWGVASTVGADELMEEHDAVIFRIERDDAEGLAWARKHADFMVDVGGREQPEDEAVVLDHHFKGLRVPEVAFSEALRRGLDPTEMGGSDYQEIVDDLGWEAVPYSSAGLVLRHVGLPLAGNIDLRQLVAHVDATDNGIKGVEPPYAPVPEGESIGLAVHKAAVVPLDGGEVGPEVLAEHFGRLLKEFLGLVQYSQFGYDPGRASTVFCNAMMTLRQEADEGRARSRQRVEQAIARCDGRILVLDQHEASLLDVLGERAAEGARDIVYAVFPSGPQWMVQQVPAGRMPCFKGIKPLPTAWKGLRDEELAKVTGVADAVFCHPGCFIGGAKSREGATRLAELAFENR